MNGEVQLAVAKSKGRVRLALTVDGKNIVYQMSREVAATMIAELARALSAHPGGASGS